MGKTSVIMNECAEILNRTNDGLDIFVHFFGEKCRNRNFSSPFRPDKNPSCRLYHKKSYYLVDFGDRKSSCNCFEAVARYLNLDVHKDFRQVLEEIDREMNLGIFGCYKARQVSIFRKVEPEQQSSSILSFIPYTQDFRPYELQYWGKYGIDINTLKRYDVQSLRYIEFCKSDGKKFNIISTPTIPIYAYFFNESKGLKIYRPQHRSRFMYAGHLPRPYVFGWKQLPQKGENVIITGGEKDVLSLSAHGFNAIAFNSETANIPPDVMKQLSERFKNIIILFDTDTTGLNESRRVVETYNQQYSVLRLCLPLAGTKKEKDISDYFAKGYNHQDFQKMLDVLINSE